MGALGSDAHHTSFCRTFFLASESSCRNAHRASSLERRVGFTKITVSPRLQDKLTSSRSHPTVTRGNQQNQRFSLRIHRFCTRSQPMPTASLGLHRSRLDPSPPASRAARKSKKNSTENFAKTAQIAAIKTHLRASCIIYRTHEEQVLQDSE